LTWQSLSVIELKWPVLFAVQTWRSLQNFPEQEKLIHKSFEDPAEAVGSDEEKLKIFRQVRDEIKDWISQIFEN